MNPSAILDSVAEAASSQIVMSVLFHRPNSVAVTDLDCNPLLIDVKKFSFALLLPFYFLPKFLPKMSGMVSYFME